ncbi:MAG TPA: zinc-ribbon domain-containing protein, partial [Kofleriaceae bacterium]|nr:zinc-ribbon domain-containing protein [Kofleriaceae bacterium]
MDVRCESCGTDYELDDAKLKKGGVTVKCANCGHMFKVRLRPETGTPPRGNPSGPRGTPPAPFPLADRTPAPAPMPPAPPAPSPADAPDPRTWMVKLESGEVRTCTELATLQQWIVTGQVTRSAQISRNGKTWKPLGGIAELSAFFDDAEDARRTPATPPQRTPRSSGTPALGVPPPPPARAPSAVATTTFSPPPPPRQPAAQARPAPPPPAPEPPKPVLSRVEGPPPASEPPKPVLSRVEGPPVGPSDRSTGMWASQKKLPAAIPDSGPTGPTGGLAKHIPTTDVAFARGDKKLPFIPDVDTSTGVDDDFEPRRGGAAKWVLLGSVIVILAAAATVYLLVFRDAGGGDKKTNQASAPPPGPADAAAPAVPQPTAEPAEPAPAPIDDATARALGEAGDAVLADDAAALERSATALAALPGADSAPAVLVARSRVAAAQAQQLSDAATTASGDQAKPLRTQAKKHAADAVAWARSADKAAGDKGGSDLAAAMADGLRLDGSKQMEVSRWLRTARDRDPGSREATRVEAMLLLRESQKLKARALLDKLAQDPAGAKDVRAHYRLALLDAEDKQIDQARAHLAAVTALQPEHAGAAALLARLDAGAAPPVVGENPPPTGGGENPPTGGGEEGGDYKTLLKKANAKAEAGNCKEARTLYARALDLNPAAVEALTGMGYCHIDANEFSSAHAKFRAALGIQPGYPGAMLGVAEAYARQGLKKQAIEAYQAFLAQHGDHPR